MNQIIPGFPTSKMDLYKVYVRSITYNQSKYIEDCLNGVLMQKTDFPLIHQVVDDCSTDGEQEVIRSWIEKNCNLFSAEYYDNDLCSITLAKAKDNPNYTIAAYFLKKNMYGNPKKSALFAPWREACPYEALCEGDDYWIDSRKLQKQVDYLDIHKECSMCFCNCKILNEHNLSVGISAGKIENRVYSADEIYQKWCVPTASVVYRSEVNRIPLIKPERFMYGDIVLFLKAQKKGKVVGFSDTMTVYRVNPGGVTQNASFLKDYSIRKPNHIQCIIDNFGDILQMAYLKRKLFDSYCDRIFKEKSLIDKSKDFLKICSLNPYLTTLFILRVFYTKLSVIIKNLKHHISITKK